MDVTLNQESLMAQADAPKRPNSTDSLLDRAQSGYRMQRGVNTLWPNAEY